jgi:trimeric autotransporter adhesin
MVITHFFKTQREGKILLQVFNPYIPIQRVRTIRQADIEAYTLMSLYSNTASNNTAVGFEAAYTNTSGTEITAVGYQALKLSTGAYNTAVGNNSMAATTTGNQNTAVGRTSLSVNTTGSFNTALGLSSLSANTTGSSNTAVGISTSSGNFNASVILGREATATASNQFVVGSASYVAGAVAAK